MMEGMSASDVEDSTHNWCKTQHAFTFFLCVCVCVAIHLCVAKFMVYLLVFAIRFEFFLSVLLDTSQVTNLIKMGVERPLSSDRAKLRQLVEGKSSSVERQKRQ